jgi:hypothetical protein
VLENEVGSNGYSSPHFMMFRVTTINVYAKGGFPSSLLCACKSVWFLVWVCLAPFFDNLLPCSTVTIPKTLTHQARQHCDFQSGMLFSFCRPQEVECLAAIHSAVGDRKHGHGVDLPIASLFCLYNVVGLG